MEESSLEPETLVGNHLTRTDLSAAESVTPASALTVCGGKPMGMHHLKEVKATQSELVLVTVQGPDRSIDLALPSNVPVKEFIPYLMRLYSLEETREKGITQIWVLGYPRIAPFGMHETLTQNEVVDGSVLSLWDFSAITSKPAAVVQEPTSQLEIIDSARTRPTHPIRRLPKWAWVVAPLALSAACVFGTVSLVQHRTNVDHPLVSLAPPTTPQQTAPQADDSLKQTVTTRQQPSKPASHPSTAPKAQPRPATAATDSVSRPTNSRSSISHTHTGSSTAKSGQHTNTNSPLYWTQQGNLAQAHGYSDKALADFLKAIKLGAHEEGVYTAVGDIYLLNKNDAHSAVQYYQTATTINPHYGYAWYRLIQAQISLGMRSDAAQNLSAALKKVPSSDPYMSYLMKWKSELNVQ